MTEPFELNFSIRPKRGLKTDAEKASEALRRHLKLHPSAPLPAQRAAAALGIRVVFPRQLPSLPTELVQHLVSEQGNQWSAAYLQMPSNIDDLIINNGYQSEARQEANIFHELGHKLCKHEPDEIRVVNGMPMREFCKEKEEQADAVGQALHLPKDSLVKFIFSSESEEDLQERYRASKKLFSFRINISGAKAMKARATR